ncbi:cadmium resistance transporter [Clostridium sp. NSJ-145]|uniref:cadmium resistance transporter n=1 Tax=Clostridium sp. NSJ-145 TaxID=2897777 RepID=UPI001E5B0C55|nr:cadmium resistance transporter [Clostridium sp. NSJ-145]MCD2502826.1 cadmium resistance transporter [Clostridium sp. NSJ-145]
MFGTIITALTSFVATNIDDIFVLMLFFSQINNSMKTRHIIIGQYLGISALIAISIIGALGISIIPNEYVGLLGLAPIYLGINEYIKYKKERKGIESTEDQENRNNNLEKTTENNDNSMTKVIKSLINPSVFKVASMTLANGGDNIGIYIPLFTSMNSMDIFITVVIFILLIALWCYIGKSLSEYPFIQRNIEKYKHIIIPIIFIGLGIFIIIKSGTIPLIYKKIF